MQEQKKINSEVLKEIKAISNGDELKKFIEEKILPLANDIGYQFSVEELLDFEKNSVKNISVNDLKNVSGGTNLRNFITGGIISFTALGAGIISSNNSAGAELINKDVTTANIVLENSIDKINKSSEKDFLKSNLDEKKEEHILKENEIIPKKISKDTLEKAEKTDPIIKPKEENPKLSLKQEKLDKKEKDLSDSTLKETNKISQEDTSSIINPKEDKLTAAKEEIPKLSSIQEKLGQEEKQAKSSDENLTLTENSISSLPSKSSSPKKDLKIVQSSENTNSLKKSSRITDEQKLYALKALNLQDAYALLESGVIENLRLYGNISNIELNSDETRNYIEDKGEDFTKILTILFPSSTGILNTNGGTSKHINFSKQTSGKKERLQLIAKYCAFLNDYRNNKCNINFTTEIPRYINDKGLPIQGDASKIVNLLDKYQIIEGTGDKKGRTIYKNLRQEKMQLYVSFIKALKQAIDLEKENETPYPNYLTEHILMAYMIKELDNEKDIENLYKEITLALSRNESSKIGSSADIKEEIKSEKERLDKLNEVINEIKIQELSPYKNKTASNDSSYHISKVKDGKVIFFENTFSDCADITARHIINLVTYSKDQNWNTLLPGSKKELEQLNKKLKEVIDAINSHDSAKFYDLKTRVQMFFLYQRGLQEDEDEKYKEYRSINGADDVTILARTLWEYVICNMDNENDTDFYKNSYANLKGNIELKSGYENLLKLMWNIAKSLNLEDINKAQIAINKFHIEKMQKIWKKL